MFGELFGLYPPWGNLPLLSALKKPSFKTSDDWIDAINKRYSVGKFPMQIDLRAERGIYDFISVCVRVNTPNREPPHENVTVYNVVTFGDQSFPADGDPDQIWRYVDERIYACVRQLVTHEFDEWWLVNGVRVKDPHAPPPVMFTQASASATASQMLTYQQAFTPPPY